MKRFEILVTIYISLSLFVTNEFNCPTYDMILLLLLALKLYHHFHSKISQYVFVG